MPHIELATEDRIATITLNRPEKLNAFAGTMRHDLAAVLDSCASDSAVRVVIITGAARAFCAGGDVEAMRELQRDGDEASFGDLLDAGARIVSKIVEMSKPVIARINGVAAGAGCNLALACDYRIASETAQLGETFVRIGLQPDWGGTWLLPRLVGASRAFELMTSGRMLTASEALSIGMVDRVAAPGELVTECLEFARQLADAPPVAIAAIKRSLRRSVTNTLPEQLELESAQQLACFRSRDAAEGLAAFSEKRKALFGGR